MAALLGDISGSACVSCKPDQQKNGLILAYTATTLLITLTNDSSAGFSYTLFIGASLQLLGFLSLILKVRSTKSVAGLSSQSLGMFAISFAFRLLSTWMMDGYLPVDSSGDMMYQVIDTLTLLCVFYLLYAVNKLYSHSYQEEYDTFPLIPVLMPCAICAYFFHGELNHDEMFDVIWSFSLNVETVQLLPQLFMLAKAGGMVDKTTAHFVANTFLSYVFRTTFWVWAIQGCPELSTEDGIDMPWNMEVGGNHILLMHAIQLIVLLDFMYYYIKAWRNGGAVMIPKMEMIDI